MGSGGQKAMARITYYGHGNRETGAERPDRGLLVNPSMDLLVTSGAGAGTTSSHKEKRLDGDIAWLLQEGMEIPVYVDSEGRVTGLDRDGLASLLEAGAADLEAAQKEQTSLRYSLGLPSKDEVGQLKGLFRRKK